MIKSSMINTAIIERGFLASLHILKIRFSKLSIPCSTPMKHFKTATGVLLQRFSDIWLHSNVKPQRENMRLEGVFLCVPRYC